MQPPPPVDPAILFEPDGYRTDGRKLMGRQVAGEGFLRAAVAAAQGRTLHGYSARRSSGEEFVRAVAQIDGQAKAAWLDAAHAHALKSIGHLYLPGPNLGEFARQRLRAGPAAWSLTGVTHTTASHAAMDAIADVIGAPVMPWDALVCTSHAVLATVKLVLQAQQEYLQWRFGTPLRCAMPQLPVIPLGVHCGDFAFDAAQRAQARARLGIAADEVVALFVGRLSFHAKAHPHAMYQALQSVARASGGKLALVQCGWTANDAIDAAFREGARLACPDVRCLFTEGRDAQARAESWAAADLFISLSDNLQETFGLTPIEAMAAGLPVLVTDWDGYRDTVRDGVDGFRIPTWMPGRGAGHGLARAHEVGVYTYDAYCGLTCQHVAVDHDLLAQRLALLVGDKPLRQRMGEAGRARAREVYDWQAVYRQYQALWAELTRVRLDAAPGIRGSPQMAPTRLDPFAAFAHYATHPIAPATEVALRGDGSAADFAVLVRQPLFDYASAVLPSQRWVEQVIALLKRHPLAITDLAAQLGASQVDTARLVAVLAKVGVVTLRQK